MFTNRKLFLFVAMLALLMSWSLIAASEGQAREPEDGEDVPVSVQQDDEPVTGVYKGLARSARIKGTVNGQNRTYTGGSMKLRIDGTNYPVFCTDLTHRVSNGNTFVATAEVQDCRIKYLMFNYPPSFNITNAEAAARQAAVWHYSDGFDPLNNNNTQNQRALEIIEEVENITNDGSEPARACVAVEDQSTYDLSLMPGTKALEVGQTQMMTVKLFQGGFPVPNQDIDLSVNFGSLSTNQVTTDANGEATFTVTSNNAGTTEVTAQTKVNMPAGTIFQGTNPERQKLVLGGSAPGNIYAEASLQWQGIGEITVHIWHDRNRNFAQDDPTVEEDLPDWTVTITKPDGSTENADTNSDGLVNFPDLPFGTYEVTYELKNGWQETTTPVVEEVTISQENPTGFREFGVIKFPFVVVNKFHDRDGDGIQDEGEEPLAGWEFALYRENGSFVLSANGVTDENGQVTLTFDRPSEFAPGTYYVQEATQDGWAVTTSYQQFIELTASASAEVTFGNRQTPQEPVRPIVECVVANDDGTYTAHFGYRNDNPDQVVIPVGLNNNFNDTVLNGSLPTVFLPGRTPYWPASAFQVDFDGDDLVWTLEGPNGERRTATASRNTQPCSNHVYIDKIWEGPDGQPLATPPNGLPADYTIEAVSELGTATCTYNDQSVLECVYNNQQPPALDNKGLWVEYGQAYTVTESNLPPGWAANDGVGVYYAGDPYCISRPDEPVKNCTHRVFNAQTEVICTLYGVHDAGGADSQLFWFHNTSGQSVALGDLRPSFDIEAIEVHPDPNDATLYVISGGSATEGGVLYSANKTTGALTKIGETGATGNDEIVGAAFDNNNELWVFQQNVGLHTVNLTDGSLTQQWAIDGASGSNWEGLAWDNEGQYLYAVNNDDSNGTHQLYRWDPSNGAQQLCGDNFIDYTIEALDFHPDGKLLAGLHDTSNPNGDFLTLQEIDFEGCQITNRQDYTTQYYDVESLACETKPGETIEQVIGSDGGFISSGPPEDEISQSSIAPAVEAEIPAGAVEDGTTFYLESISSIPADGTVGSPQQAFYLSATDSSGQSLENTGQPVSVTLDYGTNDPGSLQLYTRSNDETSGLQALQAGWTEVTGASVNTDEGTITFQVSQLDSIYVLNASARGNELYLPLIEKD